MSESNIELTPPEARLKAAADHLFEGMPDDLREECIALARLESDGPRGIVAYFEPDRDRLALVWVGRCLGYVSAAWVRGEVGGEE